MKKSKIVSKIVNDIKIKPFKSEHHIADAEIGKYELYLNNQIIGNIGYESNFSNYCENNMPFIYIIIADEYINLFNNNNYDCLYNLFKEMILAEESSRGYLLTKTKYLIKLGDGETSQSLHKEKGIFKYNYKKGIYEFIVKEKF